VLVESLQVAEYTQETVPPSADCFTVHEPTNKIPYLNPGTRNQGTPTV
jgi:hypothetical protein